MAEVPSTHMLAGARHVAGAEGQERIRPLSEEDVRRIVREEIRRAVREYTSRQPLGERIYFSAPQ